MGSAGCNGTPLFVGHSTPSCGRKGRQAEQAREQAKAKQQAWETQQAQQPKPPPLSDDKA
jgi:hypothetical protein